MDRELLEDIVLHLEAVRPQYPAGVGEGALEAGGESPVSYRGPRAPELLMLVAWDGESEAERGAARELLQAAIRKGLQRGEDEIGVLEAEAGAPDCAESVRAELELRRPRIAAVLGAAGWALGGAAAGAGSRSTCAGSSCLLTHALPEMLREAEKKRAFWGDLKTIMAELRWRTS